MSFNDLLKTRYSVRNYLPDPVEDEKLEKILEAARLAPTAANRQPQKIYVLRSDEALAKVRAVTKMAFNAPVVLMVCYDEDISWKNTLETFGEEYEGGEVDAAIVTSMMMMQATELGIGTLWVRGFDSRKLKDAFELPENIKPVCLMPMGYANPETPRRIRSRKPLDEIVNIL